ncbi:hypothetical protein [Epilithonimonas lactis]|uniref:hypothetical protein n=1 Tax=Epilithonimonas lactis TaxID=421072 RepID=UPI0008C2C109|nr:hypothetical protein [Epilithonimonas lactis]SEQ94543.1 hypothetical protein SAMN04488097_3473 [Epilithonimonas lactis]
MRGHSSLFVVSILLLTNCDYIPKDDKHPEVPFFEDIIQDKSIFQPVVTRDPAVHDSHQLFFLNNGKYISVKETLEEVPGNDEDGVKKTTKHLNVYNVLIEDLNNRPFLTRIVKTDKYSPIIVDKDANLYLDGNFYGSPDYKLLKKLKLINITDSLAARTQKETSTNIDSLNQVQLSILERKYHFKQKNDEDYIIQNDQLILFRNTDIIVDALHQQKVFDEFDDSILIEYRNDNRAFPNSYYYYYYNIGKIKFKYFDGKSGTTNPTKIEFGGQTYMYHPKFGIYRIIKK